MTELYDVIIVGGGPVGAALGIELGLNNIKTLILEKYENPLLSPRAQSLNERSMELFMRWGLVDKMRASTLLSKDYPMQGVWCSKLNGITYGAAGSEQQIKEKITAQKPIRIPLYITENSLRDRLVNFDCVTFLKNQNVESVIIENNNITVTAKNAADAVAVRAKFPPDKEPKKFADENARIAKQHSHSSGIALGYTYNQNAQPMPQSEYTPTIKPGYFLPNVVIDKKSIYEKLSPIQWTLIVSGREKIKFKMDQLKVLHVPENTYPSRYILIRPDWHIALTNTAITESLLKNYFDSVFKQGNFKYDQ